MVTGIADPDSYQSGARQYFNVEGVWTNDSWSTLEKVEVELYTVYQGYTQYGVTKQDFNCSSGDANCPLPTS